MSGAASSDQACAIAHGVVPAPAEGRRLVIVFASPVGAELAHIATHVGFDVLLLDPDLGRELPGVPAHRNAAAIAVDPLTDVVVTDHDRPELGDVLRDLLASPARWIGVMGSPRHAAPHLPALRERGVPEEDIARVHRPIGLDIGSRSPGEIAVSTVAGLLASRAGRSGGFYGSSEPGAAPHCSGSWTRSRPEASSPRVRSRCATNSGGSASTSCEVSSWSDGLFVAPHQISCRLYSRSDVAVGKQLQSAGSVVGERRPPLGQRRGYCRFFGGSGLVRTAVKPLVLRLQRPTLLFVLAALGVDAFPQLSE